MLHPDPVSGPLMSVDAHQHYWDVCRFDYGWARLGLERLDRTFLPGDLEPQLAAAGIARSVVVQALHTTEETRWLLELADRTPSIAGVVGWVDLLMPEEALEGELAGLAADPRLVGARHLIHDEPDPDWMVRPEVLRGLAVLDRLSVPFDLLLRPRHLRHVPRLSELLPGLRMVIDHVAKPDIRGGRTEPWAAQLRIAAENPNVWCKLSGMVTEAHHEVWRPSDLAPYVDSALEAFGVDRLMYGSDWPVCTLAASYEQVIGALREVLGSIDPVTESRLFGGTAAAFYRLAPEPRGGAVAGRA
jgi:L-fuconolactonase